MRRLTLYEMQDIGGARAIVPDCSAIESLQAIYNSGAMKRLGFLSQWVGSNDYVAMPKSDGYRSVHIVLSHRGLKEGWDGLLTEIQLRTSEQHAWATTVEILESILEQRLRATQGDAQWKRFLSLMSSAIALHENRATVPGTPPSITEIRSQIMELDSLSTSRVLFAA